MIVRGGSSTVKADASTPRADAIDEALRESDVDASGTPSASTTSVAATPATLGVPIESSDSSTASRDDTSLAFTDGATSKSAIDWLAVGATV